jgi:hypothetical protein
MAAPFSRALLARLLARLNSYAAPAWTINPAVTAAEIGSAVAYTGGTVTGYPQPTVTTEVFVNGVSKGAAPYTVLAADYGLPIKVRRVATNQIGSDTQDSADFTVTAALTISGTGFVLSGAAWIPYGMSDGHHELTRVGDEAIDAAMGATSLRTVVRKYGTYGTGHQQDMQQEGQPGDLKPAYLAEIVRRLTASRAAGMRNGIAMDSNKGQGAEASDGNDFFGGLTEGNRQKALFIGTAGYLAQNYGDLIDWMEPLVEPNSAVVASASVLQAFQEEFMTAVLAVAPHMLFSIGPRDYSAGNISNAIKAAWLVPGNPFYGKVFMTCNFLSNLSMDEAQRVTRAASVATARTTSGVPAWINQIATHVADDPADINLDATMALLDAASGGPIGLCYWERVSMSATADGLRYLSNSADPNSARLTHDARIAVVQAHFTGLSYWMTAPAIVGTPTQGGLVSYTTGTAAGRPAPTLTARVRVNGVDKGDAASYTIQAGDVGLPVVIRQTATNAAGAVTSDSAAVNAAAASQTYGSQQLLGANLGPTIEYTTRMWVDLMNAGRACWCPTTDSSGFGYSSVSLKGDGYPASGTTSVRVFMAEVVDWDAGAYLFECTGDLSGGGLQNLGTGSFTSGPTYNGGTNKTTATLTVPTGQDGTATIALRFNTVPADFGGVKLHAPGYALASTQKIRTEFVTHNAPFKCLRFMDQLNTNGPDGAFAGGGNQDANWSGSYAASVGHPLYHQNSLAASFQISDECGATMIWTNIPAKATDAYMASYVADGAARRPVGALWVIEFGNELWNGSLGESTAYTDIRTAAFTASGTRAGADLTSISRTSNVVTCVFDTDHGLSSGNTIYVRHKTGAFTEGSESVTVIDATTLTWADNGADGSISHADDDTFIYLNPTHTLCRQLTSYYAPEYPTANYVRIRYMLTRAKKIYDEIVLAGETANIKVMLGVWMASTFNYVPCVAWAAEEYGNMDWLYGMPPALYMEPETPNSFTSVTDVFTQLDTNATDVTLPRALRWNNLMNTWGMKCLGYESGPHTHTSDGDSTTYVLQAHEDDRMRQRLKSWQHSWTNRGGEQLMFFHAGVARAPTTPNATWPVTYGDFTDDATSAKYAAFTELATESALAVQESGVNFGTIRYIDALPDSGAFLGQVSTWLTIRPEKSVPDVTIGVAVDVGGSYALAIDACRHTDAAVAYECFVDGVSVSSGNLPSGNVFTTAPGQAFSTSVSLTAGYHLVTLHVPNASRADWVGLYRVRLT